MKLTKVAIYGCVFAVLLVGSYFIYMAWAFPETRCEGAKHLQAAGLEGDCYGCHMKATPAVAQHWYESKHGMILVRCQTCHGMPDGNGSLKFTRSPGIEVCARCHSSAINAMQAKFGNRQDCNSCHPYHQSAMHGHAYEMKTKTSVAQF